MNTENEKAVRDSYEQEIVDAYKHLHKGKLGMHWLWAAILRMNAGESEQSVMNDFGYVLDIDAALQSQSNTDGWKALPVRNIEAAFHPCEFQVTVGFKSCRAASEFMAALEAPPPPATPTAAASQESTPTSDQAGAQEATAPIGYIDNLQLERWRRLRGTEFEAQERAYIGFSTEPFTSEMTDCTLAVYHTPPTVEAAVEAFRQAAIVAANMNLVDLITDNDKENYGIECHNRAVRKSVEIIRALPGSTKALEDVCMEVAKSVYESAYKIPDEVGAKLQSDDKSHDYWMGVGAAVTAIEYALIDAEKSSAIVQSVIRKG